MFGVRSNGNFEFLKNTTVLENGWHKEAYYCTHFETIHEPNVRRHHNIITIDFIALATAILVHDFELLLLI
jgi:hypothetical protein